MNSIKLYGSGSATANAVAQVIIPSKTVLRGVSIAFIIDCITDSSGANVELSKASAREIAVNGSQQCIWEGNLFSNFVTSGMGQAGVNNFFPLDVSVVQGQIIYLHASVAGTCTYVISANFWYA